MSINITFPNNVTKPINESDIVRRWQAYDGLTGSPTFEMVTVKNEAAEKDFRGWLLVHGTIYKKHNKHLSKTRGVVA